MWSAPNWRSLFAIRQAKWSVGSGMPLSSEMRASFSFALSLLPGFPSRPKLEIWNAWFHKSSHRKCRTLAPDLSWRPSACKYCYRTYVRLADTSFCLDAYAFIMYSLLSHFGQGGGNPLELLTFFLTLKSFKVYVQLLILNYLKISSLGRLWSDEVHELHQYLIINQGDKLDL